MIRLRHFTTTRKNKAESTSSFSSESENEDNVDEKDSNRHKTVLLPFSNSQYSMVSNKKSFLHHQDTINEDEEIKEVKEK